MLEKLRQNFRPVVSEVLSFVGNPVYQLKHVQVNFIEITREGSYSKYSKLIHHDSF